MAKTHRPRTGEARKTRQPFRVDKLPEKVRDAILKARAQGRTWEETAEAASSAAGAPIGHSVCHRWYDVRVEQVQREVLAQSERARELAAAFRGKSFKDLPESAVNALSAEVFAVMEASGGAQREISLGRLVLVLSKLIAAQARQRAVKLEEEKVKLAKDKFDELRARTEKATSEAARKLAGGKPLTVADIDKIRQRTLGLPPLERGSAGSSPA
ncbi:MAG: phage protein Gp27 family protein [Candidatus Acidiferrales bacterium]